MEALEDDWQRHRSATKTWRLKVLELESSLEIDESTEHYYQEAMQAAAKECGPDHPEVAEAATYLGDLLMFFKRYVEAEALYRRALKIYGSTFGEDHMIYSMALRNLAAAAEARGKTDEAKKLRYQARDIFG